MLPGAEHARKRRRFGGVGHLGQAVTLAVVELSCCWGVAENDAVVEVAVAPTPVKELEARWPPFGLERRHQPAEPIEARFGLSDTWMIVPDREQSGTKPTLEAWDHLQTELTLFVALTGPTIYPRPGAFRGDRLGQLSSGGPSGA